MLARPQTRFVSTLSNGCQITSSGYGKCHHGYSIKEIGYDGVFAKPVKCTISIQWDHLDHLCEDVSDACRSYP